MLRFTMPPADAHLLDVREKGQAALGLDPRATAPDATGGGLATAPVCGRR
ncbi:hypothetical protein NBH00_17955 [Paraconexibacter antarcticus]|uniref:Uncharacterized protein n=1 Tax=Paraconexibacter antarcticus TaxID=2949664 RepID=A0ABY5DNK2_9ACTN|nr:hypothetical protein [Paraconexibacter antarcticus]UTI63236.1 hypothetical protein NBH00_17955 [Paraconexibacter antarcticus]